MKVFNTLVLLLFASFLLFSCKEEMKIDPYLKAHSKKFSLHAEGTGWNSTVTMGYFSSYDKQIGTLWMEQAGLMEFFSDSELITFGADNDDNYSYDHVLTEVTDREILNRYANRFNIPLETPEQFEKAYIGYLYASHDEYAMACVRENEQNIHAFLTNGFDTYEIVPVYGEEQKDKLFGYQVKLYDEYVGALQIADGWTFRMTTEYCDATEMILASIATMLIKCETQKS
jgi:hypothetical protein